MDKIAKSSIVDWETSFNGCPDCGNEFSTGFEDGVLVDNKMMVIDVRKCPKGHVYGEWKCVCGKINSFTNPAEIIDPCSCGHKLAPKLYHQVQNFIRNARI